MDAFLEFIIELAVGAGFEFLLGISKDAERKKQEGSSPNNDPDTPEA
jgi:hypothetical protein